MIHPFTFWHVFLTPHGNRLIQSRERRARLTLADIGERKRRAAIARAAAVAPTTSKPYRGATVRGLRDDRYDRGWGFLRRFVEAIIPDFTGFPWKHTAEVRERGTENGDSVVVRRYGNTGLFQWMAKFYRENINVFAGSSCLAGDRDG